MNEINQQTTEDATKNTKDENREKLTEFANMITSTNHGECTRKFEDGLTKLVKGLEDTTLLKEFESSDDYSKQLVGLYGLSIHYRQLWEYDELNKVLETYRNKFSNRYSMNHLDTLYNIATDVDESLDDDKLFDKLTKNLATAYESVNNFKEIKSKDLDNEINLAGSQHAFADLFVTYCERYEVHQEQLKKNWLKKALKAIEQALKTDYPKFYCTYGRILALIHDYDTALLNVEEAIRREKPSSKEKLKYSLKIMEYKSHMINIQTKQQLYKLNEQQEKINAEVAKSKESIVSIIEMLGFFTGIISFVIGGLNMAAKETIEEAAALILILLGSQILAYDCFSILLHGGKKNILRHSVILILGAAIIIGGIYLVL